MIILLEKRLKVWKLESKNLGIIKRPPISVVFVFCAELLILRREARIFRRAWPGAGYPFALAAWPKLVPRAVFPGKKMFGCYPAIRADHRIVERNRIKFVLWEFFFQGQENKASGNHFRDWRWQKFLRCADGIEAGRHSKFSALYRFDGGCW